MCVFEIFLVHIGIFWCFSFRHFAILIDLYGDVVIIKHRIGSIQNRLVVAKDSPPKGDAYRGENTGEGRGLQMNMQKKKHAAKRQSFFMIWIYLDEVLVSNFQKSSIAL